MNHEHNACHQPQIGVQQLPVTKWAGSSRVDLFSSRVSDCAGNAAQTEQARNPTHAQPGRIEMPVQPVPARGPQYHRCDADDCEDAAEVNDACGNVTLVDISSNGVSLVFKNDPDSIFRFAKILTRVDAHEGASRAVFLTGVRWFFRSFWIERRILTEVALDRQQISRLSDGWRFRLRSQTEPAFERAEKPWRWDNGCLTRDHRDGVVRTLRRAIPTSDTGLRIDINMTFGETRDSTGRTACKAFGILT